MMVSLKSYTIKDTEQRVRKKKFAQAKYQAQVASQAISSKIS